MGIISTVKELQTWQRMIETRLSFIDERREAVESGTLTINEVQRDLSATRQNIEHIQDEAIVFRSRLDEIKYKHVVTI